MGARLLSDPVGGGMTSGIAPRFWRQVGFESRLTAYQLDGRG